MLKLLYVDSGNIIIMGENRWEIGSANSQSDLTQTLASSSSSGEATLSGRLSCQSKNVIIAISKQFLVWY